MLLLVVCKLVTSSRDMEVVSTGYVLALFFSEHDLSEPDSESVSMLRSFSLSTYSLSLMRSKRLRPLSLESIGLISISPSMDDISTCISGATIIQKGYNYYVTVSKYRLMMVNLFWQVGGIICCIHESPSSFIPCVVLVIWLHASSVFCF